MQSHNQSPWILEVLFSHNHSKFRNSSDLELGAVGMDDVDVDAIVDEFVEEFPCPLLALNEYQDWRCETLRNKNTKGFSFIECQKNAINPS